MHLLKECSRCGVIKPLDQFSRDRSARYGRHHRCTACDRQRARERQQDGSKARSVIRWRNRHPQAVAAHNAVYRAVLRGELRRQPCRVCGCTRSHGHHEDYGRPLDVLWLCQAHHAEHHRLQRLYGRGQFLFDFCQEGRP
ncbi:hypothetical protein WJU23_00310 [Prosthecobacter sp. SYSU 5D2]|uniref:hypothetical protein n=1 Tax=Prosthecobacter sp. SYSU 5D2 TaxID=3134134 RepID=UPI0031FE561B